MGSRGHHAINIISDEEVELPLAECQSGGSGVGCVTKALADKNISGHSVYGIMKNMD